MKYLEFVTPKGDVRFELIASAELHKELDVYDMHHIVISDGTSFTGPYWVLIKLISGKQIMVHYGSAIKFWRTFRTTLDKNNLNSVISILRYPEDEVEFVE